MSRLPAEWEHQSGVQLTWPHCETEWYELEKVLECYVDIAYNILRFEPLMIVTRDIEECKEDIARITARKGIVLDVDAIRFYESPLNDTWARDHGGISVIGVSTSVSAATSEMLTSGAPFTLGRFRLTSRRILPPWLRT